MSDYINKSHTLTHFIHTQECLSPARLNSPTGFDSALLPLPPALLQHCWRCALPHSAPPLLSLSPAKGAPKLVLLLLLRWLPRSRCSGGGGSCLSLKLRRLWWLLPFPWDVSPSQAADAAPHSSSTYDITWGGRDLGQGSVD